MLETIDLSLSLGERLVLQGITTTLREGEVVGILGANGSGKSTLLSALAGLLEPRGGEVRLQGRALREMPLRERARTLAYLPQGAECHWPLSVEAVVRLGRLPFGDDETYLVRGALKAVDVLDLRERIVTELSGGERARVLLARALVGNPAWLLVDEPGAGLDANHQLALMELLRTRARAGGGVVVVLHDLGLAARFCDRLLLLGQGRLLADGPPREVLTDERLRTAHGVAVYRAEHEGEPVLVPWQRWEE